MCAYFFGSDKATKGSLIKTHLNTLIRFCSLSQNPKLLNLRTWLGVLSLSMFAACSHEVHDPALLGEISSDLPKSEAKADDPQSDLPKSDEPKADSPKSDVPKPDSSTTNTDCENLDRTQFTVDSFYCDLKEMKVKSVAELIDATPSHIRDSYTFMEKSSGLHKVSLEFPRIIFFGTDARFLMALGTDPSDKRYNVVEFAALSPETGIWDYRTMSFEDDGLVLNDDSDSCTACHGAPSRPIWGGYPTWSGAFGEQDNILTEGQISKIQAIKSDPTALGGRVRNLNFPNDHTIVNNKNIYLPSRSYGYANTVFNFELGPAVADGIANRLKSRDDWDVLKYELVEAGYCNDSFYELADVLKKYGLTDGNDFNLENLANNDDRGNDSFRWNQGNTSLADLVAFRVLDFILKENPSAELLAALEPVEAQRAEWIYYSYDLRGADKVDSILGEHSYIDIRPKQELMPNVKAEFCAALP